MREKGNAFMYYAPCVFITINAYLQRYVNFWGTGANTNYFFPEEYLVKHTQSNTFHGQQILLEESKWRFGLKYCTTIFNRIWLQMKFGEIFWG